MDANDGLTINVEALFGKMGFVVMTRLVPEPATLVKLESSGDQHTHHQSLAWGAVRTVHVVPFVLVIMRSVPDAYAVAQKSCNCGDQHTHVQPLSEGVVRLVHVIPFELVMARAIVP